MAMGTRKQREKQEGLWIAQQELAAAPEHPFYQKLNELLEAERFDEFVESRCAKFYAERNGRPSLTPGIYFRALLIGYFEGIGAERGIAWRLADSLALRRFVGISLDEYTPDHSTISRTRRLIDVDACILGKPPDAAFAFGLPRLLRASSTPRPWRAREQQPEISATESRDQHRQSPERRIEDA
jgi:Transposase domain (DUF772)